MFHEPVSSIYPAAGRNLLVDGCDFLVGVVGLYPATRFRIAAGRLSYDSGCHLLSGGQSGVVATTVTAPLERQFGQMPGLNQMTSISSAGTSVVVLQFALSLNIDVAEEEVQSAINASQSLLPANLPAPPVYSKTNPADAPVLTLAVTSNSMPLPQVEDWWIRGLARRLRNSAESDSCH